MYNFELTVSLISNAQTSHFVFPKVKCQSKKNKRVVFFQRAERKILSLNF